MSSAVGDRLRLRLRERPPLLGMLLRPRLPDHYLSTETKEVIKLAMGIIGTMTALVQRRREGGSKSCGQRLRIR